MTLKKIISIFLTFVLLFGIASVGITGYAEEFDRNKQYILLAEALTNEYVRELTHYTITNESIENGQDGFVTATGGFAYEHRVLAEDSEEGDILKAANRFYYIFENTVSTVYNVGCYNPDTLLKQVLAGIQPYFSSKDDDDFFIDFYGNRYYPTDEEIGAYNVAVEDILANEDTVTEATLTTHGIYYMKQDRYTYYNVESVLKYFLGNTTTINTGNWYHKYVFAVRTSVDTILENCDGLDEMQSDTISIRTGVYEISYARSYNAEGTKAYYAFAAPTLATVYEDYGVEFNLSKKSADLSADLTKGGQASSFLLKLTNDSTTIPYLNTVNEAFRAITAVEPTEDDGDVTATWDSRFTTLTDAQLKDPSQMGFNSLQILRYTEDLTENYSNDALIHVFGEDLGNMMTLTYIIKGISDSPSRTVRGTVRYTATAVKLNNIISDIDNLIYDADGDIAKRVATIAKQFLDIGELLGIESISNDSYDDLNELVKQVVNGFVFSDNIVNMIVSLLYPMIVDLLENDVHDSIVDAVGSTIGGWADSLILKIINNNNLAIYPNTLASRINSDYKNKFNTAVNVLSAAGNNWDNVVFDALSWGVDDASAEDKPKVFLQAACAALSGFTRLVVTVMCGDAEYTENAKIYTYDDSQFSEYLDKYLIDLDPLAQIYLRSQGGYTKLIIPLFRVLGINEQKTFNDSLTLQQNVTNEVNDYEQRGCKGYFSSATYHYLIFTKGYDYCLKAILEPIIYWVTDVLGQRPFKTLWKLIPNLVYFLTRQGSSPIPLSTIQSNCLDGAHSDKTHGGILSEYSLIPQFEQLQVYNLNDILDTTYIVLEIKSFGWHAVKIDSLGGLLGKKDMLGSLNGLLNELVDFNYKLKDENGEYIETGEYNIVAYANEDYTMLFPKSDERYVEYQDELINPLEEYYYSIPKNENELVQYSLVETEVCNQHKIEPVYKEVAYRIPAIQETKLISTTTLDADGHMVDPNTIGVINTAWNTIDVRNPGVVLMYILRYVLSALGYRYDISDRAARDKTTKKLVLPQLIECFGLDLEQELFMGLTLGDIIYNVMLHPDDAICALLELFYSNETNEVTGKNSNFYENIPYTYALTPINYHNNVLLNRAINPSLTYGNTVAYSKYWTREYAQDTVENLGELAENVLKMIGLEGFEGGLGGYLKNMLDNLAFNNDLMNTLFNTIYQLLGGLSGTLGFDIETVLKAALDVTYDPLTIGNTLDAMMGYETPASRTIKNATNWNTLFNTHKETDEDSGEETTVLTDVALDWGINDAAEHGLTTHDAFLRTAAALVSPVAFVIKFLFMDGDLSILGLININSYAGYQYAMIGLFEAFSCPDILTYSEYYSKSIRVQDGTRLGDANSVYYLLKPLFNLVDAIYADPISVVLDMLPNLLFFVSIGGFNGLLNNLVHFVYVLLDILKPLVNGYDLLGGLLSNLDIGGLSLNLSLPLDIDFNGLVGDLLGTLVGDSLEIEGVKITLPYIDFQTLCVGKMDAFSSKELRGTVRLNSASGGDLVTAVLRLAFEVIFLDENKAAISQILINLLEKEAEEGKSTADDMDKQTVKSLIDGLFNLMQTYQLPDIIMFVLYFLVTKLTPITGLIAPKMSAAGLTFTTLFASFDKDNPSAFISTIISLVSDGGSTKPSTEDQGEVTVKQEATTLLDKIKAFFAKIKAFFMSLFGG